MQVVEYETGVYSIRNTVNNKIYIGSCGRKGGISIRIAEHRKLLKLGKHWNPHLQAAWNKYGVTRFRFLIVERCHPDQCLRREQFWIDKYRSSDNQCGYNICPKAKSVRGMKWSEESKRKLSEVAKLRPRNTDETRKKKSESQKRRWARAGEKEKMSEACLLKYATPEGKSQLLRMSMAAGKVLRGKPRSVSDRAKISAGMRDAKVRSDLVQSLS